MKSLVYFCFLCCFIACGNTSPPPVMHTVILPPPAIEPGDSLKKTATLVVKDTSLYDTQFLKDLAASNFANIFELRDEVLLMDKDSTTFPTDLLGPPSKRFGKIYHFKGEKNGQNYQLKVSALNYTSLDFDFKLKNGKDITRQKKGQVHLSPFFFLGDETDTDDKTDNSYLASEYAQEVEGCYFSIRIGRDEGDLKAKIIWTCEGDDVRNIELADGPTLKEE